MQLQIQQLMVNCGLKQQHLMNYTLLLMTEMIYSLHQVQVQQVEEELIPIVLVVQQNVERSTIIGIIPILLMELVIIIG